MTAVRGIVTARMQAVSSNSSSSPGESRDLPRTFGRYTLFEEIGKGGMAQIYLARAETELGATRLAVVKQILPAFADDPRFAAMLTHEAKLSARLGHRRIVQVFDLGKENDHLYIAMEYVEGFDLNSLLRQCTEQKVALPAPYALGIVADVLEGLDYAHRRTGDDDQPLGIVHRDVSPSNVLISYEGEVKLCDFGIAHANELVEEQGATDVLKGKAGYMSPEHACGRPLDARADVYAAGILVWELLVGRRLYTPKSPVPLLEQAQRAEIPPIPDKGLPNHPRLEAIARRALAKDRDDRYPSAGAMLRDLEGYLAESGLLANPLKLGAWIAATFGTAPVEQRRASERRLPKSVPPPRSSGSLCAGALATPGLPMVAAPFAPSPVSERFVARRAGAALDEPLERRPRQIVAAPASLAGAVMDVAPSSRDAVDRATREGAPPSGKDAKSAPSRRTSTVTVRALVLTAAIATALVALARVLVQ